MCSFQSLIVVSNTSFLLYENKKRLFAPFSLLVHFKKFQNFKSTLVVADDVKTGNLGG
jgi:hypothetical protein